jgi:hypothetical protein
MDRNLIINSKISGGGVITHNTTSEKVKYFSRNVRGAITWPMPAMNIPGYFCMFGEEWNEHMRYEDYNDGRGKLRFLTEYIFERYSLSDFCKRLGEDTARLCCTRIYITGDEDFAEETLLFNKYISDHHIRGRLEEAPYWKKPNISIGIMQDWQKRSLLEIPDDTVLFGQLATIQDSDIATGLSDKFFAVQALCYLIGGFEIDSGWSNIVGYQPRRN